MDELNENAFLEKEKLTKLMRKYAIPCIISLLVAALYNIVDQILSPMQAILVHMEMLLTLWFFHLLLLL